MEDVLRKGLTPISYCRGETVLSRLLTPVPRDRGHG